MAAIHYVSTIAGAVFLATGAASADEGRRVRTPPVMFRANPRHTAFYDTPGVKTLKGVKWKFASGSGISSAPAVVNGTVYFGNWKGILFALDEKTGKEKWRFRAPKNPHYFLNTMASPAVARGIVVIAAFDGHLYAVNAATGKLKWKFQVQTPRRGIAGSPTIVGNTVYFVSHAGRFYSVDLMTGKGSTSFGTGKLVKSSPTIAGGLAVFSCYDNHLHAVDIKTGKERWKAPGFAKAHLHPAIVDGVVYAGAGNAYRGKRKGFYALDLKTGKDLWSAKPGGASPAIAYGCAFLADRKGLSCIDLKARKQKWVFEKVRGSYVYMSPGVADETVYATAANTVYAVDVKNGKERWSFKAESRILPTPVVANGAVYVATTKGVLYALH